MKDPLKRIKKKKDSAKTQFIKEIFEMENNPEEITHQPNKIKIEYNKTIYFNNKNNNKEEITQYLSNNVCENNYNVTMTSTAKSIDNNCNTYSNSIGAINSNTMSKTVNYKSNTKTIGFAGRNRIEGRRLNLTLHSSSNALGRNNLNIEHPIQVKNNSTIFQSETPLQTETELPTLPNDVNETHKEKSLGISNVTRQRSNSSFNKAKANNKKIIPKPTEDYSDSANLLFIPCMNCGSNIALNEIENHSSKCTKVSEEVLKNETNTYSLYPINYKLNKLKEHVSNISAGVTAVPKDYEKEMKYISTVLFKYLSDSLLLEIINLASVKEFKKVLKNLEILSLTYKASMSSLILIDRTKVLVNEKLKIFRETLRIQANTRQSNSSKTGYLEYESKIKEEIKKLKNLQIETELEKTKVKNLRKSVTAKNAPNRNSSNSIIPDKSNDNCSNSVARDPYLDELYQEIQDEEDYGNQLNRHGHNKIDDIQSDVGNHSDALSDNTSISAMSDSRNEEGNLPYMPNQGHHSIPFSLFNNSKFTTSTTTNKIKSNTTTNDTKEIRNNYKKKSNSSVNLIEKSPADQAREKKEFFKNVLKIKFEKLHSTHRGLQIPQKMIWEECLRLKIDRDIWNEFILGELNSPYKYSNITKKSFLGNTTSSLKPIMSIIDEEKM